jgi:hypothetical protein
MAQQAVCDERNTDEWNLQIDYLILTSILSFNFSTEAEQQTRNSILFIVRYVLVRRLLQSNYKGVDRNCFYCGQTSGEWNILSGW